MTVHEPKIVVLAGPLRSAIECSCGDFTQTEAGSGRDVDNRLLFLQKQHAKEQQEPTRS